MLRIVGHYEQCMACKRRTEIQIIMSGTCLASEISPGTCSCMFSMETTALADLDNCSGYRRIESTYFSLPGDDVLVCRWLPLPWYRMLEKALRRLIGFVETLSAMTFFGRANDGAGDRTPFFPVTIIINDRSIIDDIIVGTAWFELTNKAVNGVSPLIVCLRRARTIPYTTAAKLLRLDGCRWTPFGDPVSLPTTK